MKKFTAGILLILIALSGCVDNRPPPPMPHPPAHQIPVQNPPVAEEKQANEKRIEVEFTGSAYLAETGSGDGEFTTGQSADIVLNWFGFNRSGGPLFFNHPMGIDTDGKRLLLADTRNNRILIWDKLPKGNEPPDIVLGQPDFESCSPGNGLAGLRWPADVATDGKHIVVADTYNNRVLIWNSFPDRNFTAADTEIQVQWPWSVWTDGQKMVVTGTREGKILIWNHFPENGEKPDITLTDPDFGTPRNIETDGKTFLLIGDHNFRGSGRGNYLWVPFPDENRKYDAVITGENFWCTEPLGDDLFAVAVSTPLYVHDFKNIRGERDLLDLEKIGQIETLGFVLDDGDGSGAVRAGDTMYVSLYNGGRIVGYKGRPHATPDFVVGSLKNRNPFTEKFLENIRPLSDGKSLIALAEYSSKVGVWKNLPGESGALPDIVYTLPDPPLGGDLFNNTLYVSGRDFVAVWPVGNLLSGKLPDVRKIRGEYTDIEVDSQRVYLAKENEVLVFKQPFSAKDEPERLTFNEKVMALSGNSRYLAVLSGLDVILLDRSSLKEIRKIHYNANLPRDVFLSENRIFLADTCFNRIIVSDLDGNVIALLGTNRSYRENPWEITPEYTRNGLFWPGGVWFDGKFLWVGEYKFSHRLLRYS